MRKRDGLLEGRTLYYDPAGHLIASQHYRRDTLDGPQYEFYPDGRPMTCEKRHGGQLNGFSCGFFPSGRLEYTRYLQNGRRVGPYRNYYNTPAPNLRQAIDFVTVAGKEYANSYTEYDAGGQRIAQTGRLVARADRDTVPLGDTLVLRLRIAHPMHQDSGLSTGDYDAQFVLRRPASERRVQGLRHGVTLRVPTATHGADTVRGYMEDFEATGPVSRQGEVAVKGRRLYFAYPYFVR